MLIGKVLDFGLHAGDEAYTNSVCMYVYFCLCIHTYIDKFKYLIKANFEQ